MSCWFQPSHRCQCFVCVSKQSALYATNVKRAHLGQKGELFFRRTRGNNTCVMVMWYSDVCLNVEQSCFVTCWYAYMFCYMSVDMYFCWCYYRYSIINRWYSDFILRLINTMAESAFIAVFKATIYIHLLWHYRRWMSIPITKFLD